MRQIAIIGLGFVADLYMNSLRAHPDVMVKAICDRDPERRSRFPAYWSKNAPAACSPDMVVTATLEDFLAALAPGDVVLNLTNPGEHFTTTRACLEAGLHVWSEKPMVLDLEEAKVLHALARERNLILASAPSSVLGAAAQTFGAALRDDVAGAPRLVYAELDEGFIPQAPTESWISVSGAPWPREDEFRVGCTYEHAGYWLAWLIAAFGPVRTVVAASADTIPGKLPGEAAAPDFSVGALFFENGVVARLTCSIVARHDHRLRVFCDGGTLEMNEAWNNAAPLYFRPRFRVRRRLVEHPFPRKIKLAGASHPMVTNTVGSPMNFALGPVEMLEALAEGRQCRLGGDYALHLTEVTLSLQTAGERGGSMTMTTRCESMPLMPWANLTDSTFSRLRGYIGLR